MILNANFMVLDIQINWYGAIIAIMVNLYFKPSEDQDTA
jgi:hypothetical protein